MRRCLCVSVLLFGQLLAAQSPSPAQKSAPAPSQQSSAATPSAVSANAAPAEYSKEGVVIERLVTKVLFAADGTGSQETTAAVRVQTEAGVHSLAVLSFSYLSSSQSVEVDYVRVRKPDGSVVATPAGNVLDMPAEVTRAAPMYSDIHEKHVAVKALGVGDVLEYVVRYRILKPQVPGQFWYEYTFAQDTVVRDYELELTVPAGKYVKVVSPNYKPDVRNDGDKRVYLWKTANLIDKPAEPRRYAPSPDVQVTTFHNWNEVGQWYNQIQAPQLVATPQIKAKAAELTKGLTSEDDKIRAIYDFVSTRFHYVSLSLGNGLFVPHPAEDVLENEYGDCKDKHTLLAVLLGAAGIEAWPALISSTRQIDPDVPSPGQFDHMITYVPRGDKPLWLDTTAEVAPMGMLMAVLRDKQALVIPKDKPASLMTTPANPPFPTATNFTMVGKLSADGTFTGHVQESLRGDAEVLYRLGFRTVAPAQWKQLVQNIVSSEGFGGEVSNVQASSPEDTTKPFTFSYDYTRKDYSDWSNRQIIAPLPPFGVEGAATQQKAPLDPVVLGAPGEVHYTATVDLPLQVAKLPSNLFRTEPWADFHSQYKANGQTLTVTRQMTIRESDVPLADWEEYKQFAKAISDDWGAWVELASTAAASEAGRDKTVTIPDFGPDLEQKKRQAYDALQRSDLVTAESLVLEVLQKDPQAQDAHMMLGYIYGRRNDPEAAMEQFRKEQELYPNNSETYRAIAAYYLYKKKYDLAEEQFRKWLQIDPTNYDAMLGLDQTLRRQEKYADEVTLWEGAYKLMPGRPEVADSLGLAYVRAKQPDKALPLLEKGLATETKPIVFNDVAYTLADEGYALDKAQQWGEKALTMLETESLKPDSEEAALDNTRNLDATWDTVGWIYFRQGQFEKAEPYLHAGFALSQDSTDGDHLGQDLEKEGKKEQAAHVYRLAIASPDRADKSAIRERYVKLTGKNPDTFELSLPPSPHAEAQRTMEKPRIPAEMEPREELSRARSYKIPGAHPANGSATFAVVFSPGKIEDVQFVSGDESLKPMTRAIMTSSMRAEFPNADPTHISRRGILVCESFGCDLTLLPTDTAHAEQ
jgi:tetratricopeptide (TPR) repeat protein/transglutaminase-like putative cysteine protease